MSYTIYFSATSRTLLLTWVVRAKKAV